MFADSTETTPGSHRQPFIYVEMLMLRLAESIGRGSQKVVNELANQDYGRSIVQVARKCGGSFVEKVKVV